MKLLRVLVADNQGLTAVALPHLLDKSQFLVLPQHATSLALAQMACRQEQPDILLLAWQLAQPLPEAVVAGFRTVHPALLIILVGTEHEADLPVIVNTSADGYLIYGDAEETWQACFQAIASGHRYLSGCIKSPPPITTKSKSALTHLSEREIELLSLLKRGYSNEKIATQLSLSPSTICNNLTSLYEKLGVSNRNEAQAWSWQAGFMDAGEPPHHPTA